MGSSNDVLPGTFSGNVFLTVLLLAMVGLAVFVLLSVRRYKKYVHYMRVHLLHVSSSSQLCHDCCCHIAINISSALF